jgi:hypothetical protein
VRLVAMKRAPLSESSTRTKPLSASIQSNYLAIYRWVECLLACFAFLKNLPGPTLCHHLEGMVIACSFSMRLLRVGDAKAFRSILHILHRTTLRTRATPMCRARPGLRHQEDSRSSQPSDPKWSLASFISELGRPRKRSAKTRLPLRSFRLR